MDTNSIRTLTEPRSAASTISCESLSHDRLRRRFDYQRMVALEIYSKQRNGADDAMPHFREAFDALQAFVAKKVSLNEAPTAIAFINNVDVSCGDSMTRDGGWTESEN